MTSEPQSQTPPTRATQPFADYRPSLAEWDAPPHNRWSFQHMSELFCTAPVRRGPGPPFLLPRRQVNLDQLRVERRDGTTGSVRDIIDETFTDAWMVLHRGQIVTEEYFGDMTPQTLHLSQSVSKSMIGALTGILIHRGLLDENAPVADYVPELATGGYAGARLCDVLDMRTGVKFTEDYTDPNCEFPLLDAAIGWKSRTDDTQPHCTHALLVSVSGERAHGGPFQYRSIDNDVLGWVCERVTGIQLAALLSREIWSKLGAEQDANFTLDPAGTATASGGLSACLRDYARFGQMFLANGFFNGQQIVPVDWVAGCRTGDSKAFGTHYASTLAESPYACYSRQWWVLDTRRGIYCARGVFGQMIYIDSSTDTVAVKLSSWPTFLNDDFKINTQRAFDAVALALNA